MADYLRKLQQWPAARRPPPTAYRLLPSASCLLLTADCYNAATALSMLTSFECTV